MSRPPALWGQNVVDLRASAQIAHGLPRGWLPISAWARRIARDPLRCRANRRSSIEQRLLAEEIQRIHRGGRVEPKLPRFVLQVQYTRTVLVLFPTYSCIEAGHTGCQHGRHTNGTAYTRATYSRVHTHTKHTHTITNLTNTHAARPDKVPCGLAHARVPHTSWHRAIVSSEAAAVPAGLHSQAATAPCLATARRGAAADSAP